MNEADPAPGAPVGDAAFEDLVAAAADSHHATTARVTHGPGLVPVRAPGAEHRLAHELRTGRRAPVAHPVLEALEDPTLGGGVDTSGGHSDPAVDAQGAAQGDGSRMVLGHGRRRVAASTLRGGALRLRDGADGAELGVADVAGAGGVADVAVPEDAGHGDGGAGLVALGGPHVQARPAGDIGDTGALEKPSGHLAHGAELGVRGGHRTVVPHHGDAHGAGVDASGVRPDAHLAGRCCHGTGAPLEDGAELVDEEVVADVAPVQGDRVVVVDAPHDGGGLACGVAVGACGVVNDDVAGSRVLGIPAHVGGIGPPFSSGGHRDRQTVGGCRSRCEGGRSCWCG